LNTLYLNNYGDKWIILEHGKKVAVLIYPDKYNGLAETVVRVPRYFEAFGNYVSARVFIGGKYINTLSYVSLPLTAETVEYLEYNGHVVPKQLKTEVTQ